MNPKVIVALFVVTLAAPLRAQEIEPAPPARAQAATQTNRDLQALRKLLPGISQSQAKPAVTDPLVPSHRFLEEFRFHHTATGRNLAQKVLDLPVVRLLIPQRMPTAPGGIGHYFAWGESSRPWAAIAAGAAPQEDGFASTVNNKPHGGLIVTDW